MLAQAGIKAGTGRRLAIYSFRESVSEILDAPAAKWDVASANWVLCSVPGLISLGFCDTPPRRRT